MESKELLDHIDKLKGRINDYADQDELRGSIRSGSIKAQVCEFLRRFAGPNSSFYKEAQACEGISRYMAGQLSSILESFYDYIETGLHQEISPERKAKIETVSDILDQANSILQDKNTHSAAAAVLIGASLEEFLRTWIENEGISLGNKKPGIQNFATTLREEDLIEKQDIKDITSWSGIRNDAAHGNWQKVSDKNKISLMLQGVNLFMRKYGT